MRRFQLLLAMMVLMFIWTGFCRAQSEPLRTTVEFGEYTGNLDVSPDPDGVHWTVMKEFSYRDPFGHVLTAKPGFKTDGASIPRALWTPVGSPMTGKYVAAAVIHDVGCETHQYSADVTHYMFYLAMRKSGVSENYAKLLYWGVRVGGPRWLLENQVLIDGEIVTITIPQQPLTTLTNSDVQKMAHAFDYDPLLDGPGGLTEIEKRTPTTGPLPKNAIPK